MAETIGLVQRLTLESDTRACAWLGPTATNNTLLVVTVSATPAQSAYAANLIQTLAAAATNYRVVAAAHDDGGSEILRLRVEPV
ncbi:hypothetical protein ACWF94_10535 [Streptomyces sp. NPDC055078]